MTDWTFWEQYLPLLSGVCFILLLILTWAMAHAYREAKISLFFFIREQALLRLRRLIVITVPVLIITIGLFILWLRPQTRPALLPAPTPTPTSTITPSVPTPTATSTPTVSPTPTATPTPTPTPRPKTAVAGLPSSMLTPVADAVTPGPEAAFVDITFAKGVSDNAPVDPATSFPEGIPRIYAFFTFEGMSPGVAWTYAWYQEGTEIWSRTGAWEHGPRGRIWVYYQPGDGYVVGEYEVRVYIGEDLQQAARFEVVPSSTPTD